VGVKKYLAVVVEEVVLLPGFQKGRVPFWPKKEICVVQGKILKMTKQLTEFHPFRVNKMFFS
jgi:hypothetical protein